MNRFINKPFIPYIVALSGTYGLQGIAALPVSENIRITNSIFSFFVFIILAFVLSRAKDCFIGSDKCTKAWAAFFSVLLSVALHFGSRLESTDNVRLDDVFMWLRIVCLIICLIPVVCLLWDVSASAADKLFRNTETSKAYTPLKIWQVWGIIFLLWIPVFLALFPGAFVYDAQEEYIEVISRAFTMHHPLLHVLLLGGIVHGAEYAGLGANAGIAVYVLLQMAVMSGILAYTIKRLESFGLKKAYLTTVMVICGIFPVFPMYAVCTAKDGLFTSFLLLAVVELCVYILRVEDFDPFIFTLGSVMMMLLRNNGFYAYVAAMTIIAVTELIRNRGKNGTTETEAGDKDNENGADAKKIKKTHTRAGRVYKLIMLTVLSVVLYVGSNAVLKIATQAEDNEHQEILTVPIQQLGRTYAYTPEVFGEEDEETLKSFLPDEYLGTYSFRVSDVLKSGFNNAAYERDPSSFLSLWWRTGVKKPLVYLNAWLGTSYGYWYPDALNNVYAGNQMYTFQYTESSYFGFETEPPGHRDSKFPLLERFYECLSLRRFQQKVPVVSQLFSPGFMWWVCAFVLFGIFARGRRTLRRAIPLLPVVMLWLTVLLGPTTLVRYVLILWFVIPLYPVFIRKKDDVRIPDEI